MERTLETVENLPALGGNRHAQLPYPGVYALVKGTPGSAFLFTTLVHEHLTAWGLTCKMACYSDVPAELIL